jgi:hypothetical protein
MRFICNCIECDRPKFSVAKYLPPKVLKKIQNSPCNSCSKSGIRNSQYGTKRTEAWKQHIGSINKKAKRWNDGKKLSENHKLKISDGIKKSEKYRNSIIERGYRISLAKCGLATDLSPAEYDSIKTDKYRYYQEVWKVTNTQPIEQLENFNKRGKAKKGTDNYQLDHIIPIIEGYNNNISPNIIGNITNLRMIPWEENIKRQYESKI